MGNNSLSCVNCFVIFFFTEMQYIATIIICFLKLCQNTILFLSAAWLQFLDFWLLFSMKTRRLFYMYPVNKLHNLGINLEDQSPCIQRLIFHFTVLLHITIVQNCTTQTTSQINTPQSISQHETRLTSSQSRAWQVSNWHTSNIIDNYKTKGPIQNALITSGTCAPPAKMSQTCHKACLEHFYTRAGAALIQHQALMWAGGQCTSSPSKLIWGGEGRSRPQGRETQLWFSLLDLIPSGVSGSLTWDCSIHRQQNSLRWDEEPHCR